MDKLLENVDIVFFDLDDTLYPRNCGIRKQIVTNMCTFVMQTCSTTETTALSNMKSWYQHYGSALQGLISEHDVDPTVFLKTVYSDLNFENLVPTIGAKNFLAKLKQRKIILTNSPLEHAECVLDRLGFLELFTGNVISIETVGYMAKPNTDAYKVALKHFGVSSHSSALMIDDSSDNLYGAKAIGMKTVKLGGDIHIDNPTEEHIDAVWPHFEML